MRCYFDGSEGQDDNAATWLTLAGYMAPDSFWGRFQGPWERMLRERYPVAPYIHMIELLSRDDPFEWGVAGWDKTKIDKLILDAVDTLQQMDKREFCSFICSIDVSARGRLVSEGYNIPEPVVICADLCVGLAFNWYYDRHPNGIEMAYILFDRGEDFIREFKARWLKERTPPGKVAMHLFWDLIADVQESDMASHPGLQAADMMAWARSRSLSERERDWRYLAEIMHAIIPTTGVFIDEQTMRKKYSRR